MSLNGKRALITGSSRGIGRGIALKLAEHGVKVAVHYYKNKEAATDTLAKVRERGADGFAVQADVSRPEEIRRMFSEVQSALGGLDIFVSNARPDLPGFYHRPLEITLEQWHVALDSQARAFLWRAQESARIMPKGGESLRSPTPRAGAQGAGSRGLPWGPPRQRWIHSFATSRWPWPHVASLSTGSAPGAFSARLTWLRVVSCAFCRKRSRTQFGPGMRAAGPRWAGWPRPEDIGNAVMLLCMDEASFITGQILHVDGGASIMDTVLPLDIQRG